MHNCTPTICNKKELKTALLRAIPSKVHTIVYCKFNGKFNSFEVYYSCSFCEKYFLDLINIRKRLSAVQW